MTNRSRALVIVVVLLAMGTGFVAGEWQAHRSNSTASEATTGSAPVARFEGGEISADRFLGEVTLRGPLVRDKFMSPEGKRKLLDEIVRTELLAREAKTKGYDRDPEVVRRYENDLAQRYLERDFDPQLSPPTDAELRAWYDAHPESRGRPEQVHLAHIFLAAPKDDVATRDARRRDAQKLLAEVQAAQSKDMYAFASIARRRSDDPESRSKGGELPPLTAKEIEIRLGSEVVAASTELQEPGTILGRVVETTSGFQIIQLLDRDKAVEAPFEAVRESIRPRVSAEKREKALTNLYNDLEKKWHVQIDEAELDKLK